MRPCRQRNNSQSASAPWEICFTWLGPMPVLKSTESRRFSYFEGVTHLRSTRLKLSLPDEHQDPAAPHMATLGRPHVVLAAIELQHEAWASLRQDTVMTSPQLDRSPGAHSDAPKIPPRASARTDLNSADTGPRWITGAVAAAATIAIYWIACVSYGLGMLTTVAENNLQEFRSSFLFVEVTASYSFTTGGALSWTSSPAWLIVPVVLVSLVFLIASRAWRVLTNIGDQIGGQGQLHNPYGRVQTSCDSKGPLDSPTFLRATHEA